MACYDIYQCVNGYTFSKYNYPKGKPLTSNLYIPNTQAPDVNYIYFLLIKKYTPT